MWVCHWKQANERLCTRNNPQQGLSWGDIRTLQAKKRARNKNVITLLNGNIGDCKKTQQNFQKSNENHFHPEVYTWPNPESNVKVEYERILSRGEGGEHKPWKMKSWDPETGAPPRSLWRKSPGWLGRHSRDDGSPAHLERRRSRSEAGWGGLCRELQQECPPEARRRKSGEQIA